MEQDPHSYASHAGVDDRVISETDREALAFAWSNFGGVEGFRLADLTHCYPEWKRHEAALASKSASRVPMDYEDFLDDPETGCNPCHPLMQQERADRLELIRETATFESRWR